ncbi:MAG: hypothetical protein DI604_23535 [Delftia acidovorans]|nr:MAG: hypothetical protein DI604_23535 [Delftia acidovorans]
MDLLYDKHRQFEGDHGSVDIDWHVQQRPALERSALNIALEGIGTPALMNGIAAVLCFTFMVTAIEADGAMVAAVKGPSVTFAIGLGTTGVAFVLACLAMWCTSGASQNTQTNGGLLRRCAFGSHYLALVTVIVSYCLFLVGGYMVHREVWP